MTCLCRGLSLPLAASKNRKANEQQTNKKTPKLFFPLCGAALYLPPESASLWTQKQITASASVSARVPPFLLVGDAFGPWCCCDELTPVSQTPRGLCRPSPWWLLWGECVPVFLRKYSFWLEVSHVLCVCSTCLPFADRLPDSSIIHIQINKRLFLGTFPITRPTADASEVVRRCQCLTR